jgi:hypothetical protein
MQYKYLAVYKLIGVTRPADGEEQVLVEYPAINAKALITYDVDGHLLELDKASVIGFLMLKGVFGPATKGTFEERLAHELEELKEKREKDVGQGVFIIFEAEGEVESFDPRNEREMPDFIIAIDGAPKQPIRSKYQAPINGLLASFALGSDQICGVKKVTDGVVFVNEDGKPVYSYTFEMSGKAIVSTSLMEDSITFVKNNAKALGKYQELVDSARLLSRSLDEGSDDLQSFLSVWAGLEIFISKNFKEFEEVAFKKLSGGTAPPAPSKFLQRIKGVMKDKYRLTDKFSVVSFELSPDSSEEDIKSFEVIKDVRDKLMHGHDISVSSLPTEDARKLLRKYLKLHAQRIGA